MKRILFKCFFTFLFIAGALSNYACTIFVLTDSKRTLFFNNEDWIDPVTHMWFLPGSKEYYGVAYVGFNNDWAQGGVNTAGLAFDWVNVGGDNGYRPDPKLLKYRGVNANVRMLESCATVDDAIAFYKKYREISFSEAKVMIADKTGASVIIGARNGQMYFDRSNQSRGFGYGEKALTELLAKSPAPTLQDGLPILQACKQQGQSATKYSNVYDLRSGDIFMVSPDNPIEVKLNLLKELAKGAHYYDIPRLKQQLTEPLIALRPGMKRFLADGYTPITDPVIEQRVKAFFEDAAAGNLKAEAFTKELWKEVEPLSKQLQEETKRIRSFNLVERKEINNERSCLYLIEYEDATILERVVINDKNQIAGLNSEFSEPKP